MNAGQRRVVNPFGLAFPSYGLCHCLSNPMRLSIARTLRKQRRELTTDGWIRAVVDVEADQRVVAARGGDQLGARVPYPGGRHDCGARPERHERLSLQSAFGNQA